MAKAWLNIYCILKDVRKWLGRVRSSVKVFGPLIDDSFYALKSVGLSCGKQDFKDEIHAHD